MGVRVVKIITKSLRLLESLRHPNGLFSASKKTVKTGYDKSWIRDNVYQAIGLEAIDPLLAIRTYHSLLDILLKHEGKIVWAIKNKPIHAYQYIHARYDPSTLNEIWDEWGNKQNDAVGLLLFKIGDLEKRNYRVIRNDDDRRILQKLVDYLKSVEYWKDRDNGIWEENEEVHASSIGACVAGLEKIKGTVHVDEWLIIEGKKVLDSLLPCESATKEADMALLSLIYPFSIVTEEQAQEILKRVEESLVRERGIIRYENDQYYNIIGEAEWCMGFPWLAIIYKQKGDITKYQHYLQRTLEVMNAEGELPELYYSNTNMHNENSPLGWGQALYMVAVR